MTEPGVYNYHDQNYIWKKGRIEVVPNPAETPLEDVPYDVRWAASLGSPRTSLKLNINSPEEEKIVRKVTHRVFVMDNNFDPPRIEVSVGDDVVWNVVSFISHVQIKWAGADPPFPESDVLANGSMHCVKFSSPGTYRYIENLSKRFGGEVIVRHKHEQRNERSAQAVQGNNAIEMKEIVSKPRSAVVPMPVSKGHGRKQISSARTVVQRRTNVPERTVLERVKKIDRSPVQVTRERATREDTPQSHLKVGKQKSMRRIGGNSSSQAKNNLEKMKERLRSAHRASG